VRQDHLVPVDTAGVQALNQTQNGKHAQVQQSDPANPQYGATVEVFHQLHCLVSPALPRRNNVRSR
jgi:hypothetical protein